MCIGLLYRNIHQNSSNCWKLSKYKLPKCNNIYICDNQQPSIVNTMKVQRLAVKRRVQVNSKRGESERIMI